MANNWNEYIDDDCLIQDENYLTFKPLMECFICKKILKNPVMCSNCQSNFCKKVSKIGLMNILNVQIIVKIQNIKLTKIKWHFYLY